MVDYLAKKNPHVRDYDITFDEKPHIYTIKGDSSFTSVTTWNHSHFEEFDADAIIDRMMRSKKWPESKYFGLGNFSQCTDEFTIFRTPNALCKL